MSFPVHSLAEQKREVEKSLARTTLTQIEKGTISFAQGQEIANFILQKIDQITTEEELVSFVYEMSEKWPIFDTIKEVVRLRMNESKEVEKQLQKARQGGDL